MPLLQVNQVKKILRDSDLKKDDIERILNSEGLGAEEVIAELGTVMRGADSSAIKLRAIDTALKLNGLMKNDDGPTAPIVNIIINDPEFSNVNPIFLPRELNNNV